MLEREGGKDDNLSTLFHKEVPSPPHQLPRVLDTCPTPSQGLFGIEAPLPLCLSRDTQTALFIDQIPGHGGQLSNHYSPRRKAPDQQYTTRVRNDKCPPTLPFLSSTPTAPTSLRVPPTNVPPTHRSVQLTAGTARRPSRTGPMGWRVCIGGEGGRNGGESCGREESKR